MPTKTNTVTTMRRAKSPGALAEAIEGVGKELGDLYHLEQLADNMGGVSGALSSLANATAASVIAQHGSDDDKARVVEYLKGWFWESDTFRER